MRTRVLFWLLITTLAASLKLPASARPAPASSKGAPGASTSSKHIDPQTGVSTFEKPEASDSQSQALALTGCKSQSLASIAAEDTYIGNIESMKFHLASCDFAEIMARRRRIKFKGKSEAKRLGMSPCNWCMPSWTLSVEAKLIQPLKNQALKKSGTNKAN